MKILYLGDIGPGQTCLMRMRALERLGHDVYGVDTVAPWKNASWSSRQWQRRARRGPIINEINRQVQTSALEFRPNLLWADKQQYLRLDTLESLSRQQIQTVHFTPDPYFTLAWKRTPLMDQALNGFDAFVCCKAYEMKHYEALGKPVHYMPLGYCDEVHRPVKSSDLTWNCMAGFLGGWEPRRERFLASAAKLQVDLKIWGGYWDFLRDGRWTFRRHLVLRELAGNEQFRFHRDADIARCLQGGEVYGDDYARALSGAKIGLGFLRKVCPDQHTTRTFEIPACGSMLLADRTEEHQGFFEEGKEAEFFDSPEELLGKLQFYASHEHARERVAMAGRQRCIDGEYAYIYRMRRALQAIAKELRLCL